MSAEAKKTLRAQLRIARAAAGQKIDGGSFAVGAVAALTVLSELRGDKMTPLMAAVDAQAWELVDEFDLAAAGTSFVLGGTGIWVRKRRWSDSAELVR